MRRTRKLIVAALALAAILPVLTTGFANADEGVGGSASGVVWNDLDADGRRGEDEYGISGQPVFLRDAATGVERSTNTDVDGAYRFAGLPAGDYELRTPNREDDGQTWTRGGGDSEVSGANGLAKIEITAAEPHLTSVDAGFARGANDYYATTLVISPKKDRYEPGEIVTVVGGASYRGDLDDRFGARLTFPEQLAPLVGVGVMPHLADRSARGEIVGAFTDTRARREVQHLGARFRVTAPLSRGEITLEVLPGDFGASDKRAENNSTSITLGAQGDSEES
ncbi:MULTISPECIES: SdrD B-like domain-containing protein [Actinosynnema]|uniref:SdrD B-like domain-containing protein n=1 Tax=Actinosynnema TaxID=40566 RepID=UPI0020A37526|nr:SdrD B-like domain-containing protein [Actinosynnema pretiosum]MCP2093648.1 Carboxypeptidase regulatory-like domain-containing protein [Actinosynnema pretiosum]